MELHKATQRPANSEVGDPVGQKIRVALAQVPLAVAWEVDFDNVRATGATLELSSARVIQN
jgi:hypothetical protein